ncbi:hypothetical protein LTR53_005429 [Teratosphaeriaceae sp. CCFEE 6253]|nr:hypothetical protein LTR53_005429 [Teratosphaeriaceae sp. CCFEE 6253]
MPLGDQYGFYWYHSHFKTYYNDAIRGPLLIRPSPSRRRPFDSLAANDSQLSALLQAERSATPVLLTDWYHNLSNTIYDQYMETGAFPNCVDSLLANGQGRVQCLPSSILAAGTGLGLHSPGSTGDSMGAVGPMASMTTDSLASSTMEMSSTDTVTAVAHASSMPVSSMAITSSTSEMAMGANPMHMKREATTSSSTAMSGMPNVQTQIGALGPRGCTPPGMFRPGYDIGSLLPETCVNTSSSLLTIKADHAQGWLFLHLVNAGATTKLSVSLDAHTMFVYAADGLFVEMQEVKVLPISIGQRYSVIIKLDQEPGQYYLRFASVPLGDMQQVIEDQAIIEISAAMGNDTLVSQSVTMGSDMSVYADPQSTWMLANGSAKLGQSTLNEQYLAPFDRNTPPTDPADSTHVFTINQTDVVTWVVDKASYVEAKTPILLGNQSDGWNANTTLHMPYNSTIDIVMTIAQDSMDSVRLLPDLAAM